MDVRFLNLDPTKAKSTKVMSKADFALNEEDTAFVESLLPTCVNIEFWHPLYHAWRPFMLRFLDTCSNERLTKQYYKQLAMKEHALGPEPNDFSRIYSDVIRMKRTQVAELFDGIYYSEIQTFMDKVCYDILSDERSIVREIYRDSGACMNTMQKLLKHDSNEALMRALMMFRLKQNENFGWEESTLQLLVDRSNAWFKAFHDEFYVVQEFLQDKLAQYSWYNDIVMEVISRVWQRAAHPEIRTPFITAIDVAKLPAGTADDLTIYANSLAPVKNIDWSGSASFDAIFHLMYSNRPDFEYAPEYTCWAFMLPRRMLKSIIDWLFYFSVGYRGTVLTQELINRFEAREDETISLDKYKSRLEARGFPMP